jgi:hypothetical protein
MIVDHAATRRARGARFAAPPPAAPAASIDDVIEAHRTAWLRDAEAALTVLDWQAFSDGRTLHVLDFAEIGAPDGRYLGFTIAAELHVLAADFIPRRPYRTPAAAVAVNVNRIARNVSADPDTLVDSIRAAVAATAAHELAHAVAAQAAGHRAPEGTTLENQIRCLADGRASEPAHRSRSHGPAWLRAFAHLTTRAARFPNYRIWLATFIRDVENVRPHPAQAYVDALDAELARNTFDDRLVEILRQPAPPAFLKLFETDPATQET